MLVVQMQIWSSRTEIPTYTHVRMFFFKGERKKLTFKKMSWNENVNNYSSGAVIGAASRRKKELCYDFVSMSLAFRPFPQLGSCDIKGWDRTAAAAAAAAASYTRTSF